jgi:hypothetical protein
MESEMITRLHLMYVVAVVAVATLAQSASAQETSKQLLAIQARAQGYPCDQTASATRDKKRSGPVVSVWVLQCERNSYRMTLGQDMAARVQPLK